MPRWAHRLTLLLAALLWLAPGAHAQQGSVATDKAALVALYNATDGANWTDSTNWGTNEDLASWHGVTTNGDGRVTRLELQENGLNGTLPTELENLAHLESLLLDRNYALMGPLPDGLRELSALATVDLSHTELCAPEDADFQTWLAGISFAGLTCPPMEQSVIDVAVFYTPAARDEAGGSAAIKTQIDLMAAETNQAYRASGVNQRVVLAAVEEVEYGEDPGIPIDRLQDPSDGHMDEVHTTRDQVAADIVLLILSGSAGLGGSAYGILTPANASAANAFAWMKLGRGTLFFAHELGHLMGLAHDRYAACVLTSDEDGCGPAATAYAFGYVNQRAFDADAPVAARWRTIMAYTNQCSNKGGLQCPELLRFSNPDQIHPDPGGDPLGVAGSEPSTALDGPADAVRTLNRTRATVANFRTPTAVTVSFGATAYTAAEGGEAATVTVNLSPAPERPVSIPLVSVGATGATASDYTAPGSVAFAATETVQTFTVTAVDDAADDDGETVTLAFDTRVLPSGMTVGSPATSTVTLTDDDLVTAAPSVRAVALTSDPGPDAIYALGDEIAATVRFDKSVTVTVTPQLGLTVGSGTPRQMTHRGGGGEVLTFAYTVAEDDSDTDGVSIAADSLSGTIRDGADEADLTHAAVEADAGHRVDGVRPVLQGMVVDGEFLNLTYDERLGLSVKTTFHARDAFTVTNGDDPPPVVYRTYGVSGPVLRLLLSRPVIHGQEVTVSYTPGAWSTRDAAGTGAAAFSDRSATNETPEPHYDPDHDGLIEITTLAQLDAIRHDLNSNGVPTGAGLAAYSAAFPLAFPDEGSWVRCGGWCTGYELLGDLDFFDINGDGQVDSNDDTNGDGQVATDDTPYWNGGAGWQPIGTGFDRFQGTFEGNGHTIRHLFINRPAADHVGLFGLIGYFGSGTIRAVGVIDVDVTGNNFVGGLVGRNRGGVTASYATGPVSGGSDVGGLVGGNSNYGTITASYATGPVSGDSDVGGLVGGNSNYCTITASYATGPVSGGSDVGGLVGGNSATITASYATGPVSGNRDVGGLVGLSRSGEISASYWDTTTSGQATSDGGAGQSTGTLQAPTGYSGIYADWNVDLDGEADDPWHFGASDQYPVLKADLDGDGTASWQEFGHQLRGGPTLTAGAGVGQVVLEWAAVDAGHWSPAPAVTYTLYRDDGATVEAIAENLSGLGYTDTDVTAGETYTYQVAAVVTGGEAARSALTTSDPVLPNMWLNPPASDPVAPVRSAATYSVTFQGTWTTTVTSGGVPSGAHFTTLIGGVHNAEVTFLREGGMASAGVESMAELGGTPTLESEINAAMPNAFAVIEQSIASGGTATATVDITLPTDHPRVTLLSMVAPSPDWFVGVSGLTLLDDQGDWLASRSVDLYPWDAGTEEGTEFSLSNDPTIPQSVITNLRGMGKFSNEPIATLTFTRQSINTAPELMLAASPSAIVEAGGSATVTVEITNGVTFEEDQEIALAFAGTATKGTDYTVALESLTLTAGESSVATTITAVQDRVDDDAETILITASHGGGTIGAEQTITIIDDDAAPAVTTCSDGMAGTYPCSNVDLMSFLALADIGGGSANDIWGWTDSSTGKEYAIMGRTNGTSFVDISDPVNPIYLGNLPPPAAGSTWRDIKVYADHAFIVTEARGSGMQVFDLTQLRMVASPPATFSGTAHYPGFSYAHNLVINEDSGFAYAVGTNNCSGGLHMIDIQTPTKPTSAGCFSADGYTHDAQCVNYDGPDLDHQGKEICFNSNLDTLTIVDVTNKAGPVMLSRTGYSGSRDTHQGWLTEDQVYFLLGDEKDEAANPNVTNTRTYMWDVSDLDDPALIGSHDSTTTATDHNQYVKGSYTYQSNYQAGLRILDITDIANGNLTEVAFFDVYPGSDSPNEDGTWSNYPFFDSGIVIVSVIEQGLFILRPNLVDGVNPALSSASVNGAALTLTYGEVLDESSTPATDAFTVTVAGSGRTVTYVSVSGRVVTLTLASVVAHDETVTVSYSPGTNPIQDAAGNAATGLSNDPVRNATPDTTPPTVMSITSEATHPTKDRFTVTIIFTEEVTGLTAGEIVVINGLGSNFAGAGAAYRLDIEPSANIEDDVTVRIPADAAVDDANIGNVEGSETFAVDTRTPTVSTVKISSDPGADRIYAPEDEIQVTVTFSEPVDVERTPRLMLKVGDRNRSAGYREGTGTTVLVFAYEVAEGDEDTDGVSIEANSLSTGGGTVRDGADNDALLDHDRLTADSGHKVDGAGPDLAETGGAVVSTATLTLTFDETLDGSSTPQASAFRVTGGDTSRTVTDVALSGSAVLLTLDPAVEHAESGIRVSYTVPTGTGASPLQDVLGNAASRLSNVPVTNETPDTTPPTVSKLEISSDPGTDATYVIGDAIGVTVTFSETVEVTGRPRLQIELGGGSRTATYEGGSGTAALVFEYEVAEGESDIDGVGVEADSLTGGTIRDEARNDAGLDHDGLAADAGHKVDGVKPELAASGGAVVNGTRLRLTYDEPLDGSPRPETGDFTVSGGDQARTVTEVRVNGSAVLLTLDAGAEHLETGILVSYTPGTNPIRDVPGNQAEGLSRQSVTNETPDTTPPEVESLGITSNPGSDRTYAAGDEIRVTVTFNETVQVTGMPQLRLRVGSRTRTAGYDRGTGTAALVFGYEVVEGDEDSDGVSIEAGRIALNGGTLEDEAENAAELAHEALAAQAGHQVDGVRPAFVSAAVEGASLTLSYGEALDSGSRPASGDFTVEVDGSGRSVSGVSVSGSGVTLFLNPAVEHGDTGIRVSYTQGTNPLRDAVGNQARGLNNQSVTNTTGAPNTAPEITSPSSFDVPENQAMVRRLAARDSDPGDEVTGWAVVGGADRFQFSIAPDTGELSFRDPPDYEAPRDNQYLVRVEVTSGAGARELTAAQTLAVRVTDEREPPGIPEPPVISGETADSLRVSWSEPDNTGPPITDYDVQVREEDTGGFTGALHEGPGLSLTLTDLEAGTVYQVQVRATNEEGTSGWSASGEGMTVTPLTVVMASGTDPPVSGPFTMRFSFSEPVTGFSASDIDSGQNPACRDDQNNTVFCDPGIGALQTTDDRVFTATVTPWTDRVAHSYTLRLTVAGGAVRSSVGSKPNEEPEEPLEVRVAPPGVTEPISSLGLTASGGNGTVRLSWNRPSDNGGSAIIRYEIRYQAVGEAWSEWENVGAGSRSVTVGNLVNGQEYVFEVRAVNALGKGGAETVRAVPELRIAPPRPPPAPRPPGNGDGGGLLFPPEAPAGLMAMPGEGAVRLQWSPPDSDGGTPILRYEYRLKEGRGEFGEWTPIADSAPGEVNATGYTVGELGNGTVYVFELRAVNLVGEGRVSEAVEVVMGLDPAYWSNFGAEDLQGSEAGLEHTPFGGTPRSVRLRFGAGLRFEESELEGEVTGTRSGGYGYRYTSRTTGELRLDYDGGASCELRLTFRGVGAGSYSYRCGGRLGGQGSFRLSGLNRRPEITGAGVFEVAENRAVVGQLEAVDPDEGDGIEGYGIAGGADASLFVIEAETGDLRFREAPDYEDPGDVESAEPASGAGDNEYIVVVEVRSGEGERERKGSRAIRVRVSDEEEPPEITSVGPFEVVENQTMVGRLEAVDQDKQDEIRGYGIAGGADGELFAVEEETGELLFREAPDYENPADVESEEPQSGAADNEYIVVVEVRSGEEERERSGKRAIRVQVSDEEEPPGAPAAPVVTAEGSDSLKVIWREPENRGPEIMDYEVRYREAGEEGYSDGGHQGTGLMVRLSGLKEGTSYEVQVRAVNQEGMSEWSEPGEGRTDREETDPDDPSDFSGEELEGRRLTLRQADADGTTRSLELRFGEDNRFEQIESGGQEAATRSEGASRSGSYSYEKTGPGRGTVRLAYDDGSFCEIRLSFAGTGVGGFVYDCGGGAPAEGSFRLTTGSLFVPVILSAAGQNQSLFTSELTLTNRGEREARLHYTYTAHIGGGSGRASDVLAPGRQKIETDALVYLRGLGIPIPETGNRIGTLRVEARLGSEVEAVVRTTTAVPEGRAGLAYPGVAAEEGFQVPVYLCGLRQNSKDRSNLAFQNMGAPEEGAITMRTTVYSGEAGDTSARVLEDVKLEPGGFHQYSGLLGVLESVDGNRHGYVKVERVEGRAPFYAYGVINDQANSDGSFVFPVTASSLEGTAGQTLPVIVETSAFTSELTVTNFSEEARTLQFSFVAGGVETPDRTADFTLMPMRLEGGEQRIIPDIVAALRQQGVEGIGPSRGGYAGALFATVENGDMSGIVIGARTGSEGGGGQYSVFYNAAPFGEAFSEVAWVEGLQQNQENRSNLALVNTGEVDDSASVFRLEIYDGETGMLVTTIATRPIPARGWHQINGILGRSSPETRQGYIRILKVSGENPFLAYGVVNDGGAPGERSGDGAYLPARE